MTTATATAERTLHKTTSLCTVCKTGVPAEMIESQGRIVMRKVCPEHGMRTVLISSDAAWYHETMKYPAALKRVLKELFPGCPIPYHEQQIISERSAKAIYIHSHMDDDSFDTDRIRQCCVGGPAPDGGNIPTCSYNILYRGRDHRFSKLNLPPLSQFEGGRKWEVPVSRA